MKDEVLWEGANWTSEVVGAAVTRGIIDSFEFIESKDLKHGLQHVSFSVVAPLYEGSEEEMYKEARALATQIVREDDVRISKISYKMGRETTTIPYEKDDE